MRAVHRDGLSSVHLDILRALDSCGRTLKGAEIGRVIKDLTGRPVSTNRVYVALGELADHDLINARTELVGCASGRVSRTFVSLTARGRQLACDLR